jgi:hypothetical protein
MDLEAEIEVDAGVEVEVEIDIPQVEVEIDSPEVEVEVEIDMPQYQVEVDIPEVEVEVEIDMPQYEVEVDIPEVEVEVDIGGFVVSDPLQVEVELEANVEVEVEIDIPFGVSAGFDVDVDSDVELEIEPQVEIQIGVPEFQVQASVDAPQMVTIEASTSKKATLRPHSMEVDLLSKDPSSRHPFLQKIWVWLAMQAGIPWVTVSVLMMFPSTMFTGIATMALYNYVWWGAMTFLLIWVLISLLRCTRTCFCGLIIWIMVLIGSLSVFGLNAMRRQGTEGASSVIFLGMLFSMLCGLCVYSRSTKPTYETCTVFSYTVIPQVFFALFICVFYSYGSGMCIGYMVVITLFALVCKGSAKLILDDEKHYSANESVSASQKMYTDFFSVFGHFLHEFYKKSEGPREIIYTFN